MSCTIRTEPPFHATKLKISCCKRETLINIVTTVFFHWFPCHLSNRLGKRIYFQCLTKMWITSSVSGDIWIKTVDKENLRSFINFLFSLKELCQLFINYISVFMFVEDQHLSKLHLTSRIISLFLPRIEPYKITLRWVYLRSLKSSQQSVKSDFSLLFFIENFIVY